MPRTLVVTNDFPPRPGGIQSYLHALATRLPDQDLVVYAPSWETHRLAPRVRRRAAVPGGPPSDGGLMLPTPAVARRATRDPARRAVRHRVVRRRGAAGAARAAAARAGARRVIASTHGHEVGWSMLPGARQALRRIGSHDRRGDVRQKYTRSRFASAFGPMAALEYLPSGVDTEQFQPDFAARKEIRARYGLGDRPTVVCVSRLLPRKGQDMLIRALPADPRAGPGGGAAAGRRRPVRGPAARDGRAARRRRARDHDRPGAVGGAARALRRRRRVRDAVPHARPRPGRRGPWHRVPRGVGVRACRSWPAGPAAHRRRCSKA